ncbi:hypothetical protein [Spirosoma sordidisoli]|uniref:Lipocalin-like domain-containing protein n=1 Tax=Spirosoma sordidisoli TaxID=2502893 RepID=A0A4Q2UKB5_9BACT|nr:hypothetical protein [Spirosoma sordidisoli]RYC69646.1 hypothetical protein EQG79_13680 [Spirosoma sordidisoli]
MKQLILILALLFAFSCEKANEPKSKPDYKRPKTKSELLQAVADGRAVKVDLSAKTTTNKSARPAQELPAEIVGSWRFVDWYATEEYIYTPGYAKNKAQYKSMFPLSCMFDFVYLSIQPPVDGRYYISHMTLCSEPGSYIDPVCGDSGLRRMVLPSQQSPISHIYNTIPGSPNLTYRTNNNHDPACGLYGITVYIFYGPNNQPTMYWVHENGPTNSIMVAYFEPGTPPGGWY